MHGAHDRHLVGMLGDSRKQVADLDAGYIRRDGFEGAPDTVWRGGLGVPHIQLRGAPAKKYIDTVLGGCLAGDRGRLQAGFNLVPHADSKGTQGTHANQVPARQAGLGSTGTGH